MNKPTLFLAALLATLLLGCAHKKDEAADTGKTAKSDDSEYIYVDSGLGSRIPRRIRIDQLSRATLRGGAPTATATGEGVREILSNPIPASGGTGGFNP